MFATGFKAADQTKYENLLFTSHLVKIKVQILNLNHGYIGDVSDMLLEGQVDFDGTADITTTASITLYDPNNSMDIYSDSPLEGAAFMDRMVKIVYNIAPPDESKWYSVPIFCGPMSKVDRDADTVQIEAQGKEYLMYVSVYSPQTYKKGKRKTTVLKDILRRYGETKIDIPDIKGNLGSNLSISNDSVPWNVCESLGGSRFLFYDGRGYCRLRPRSGKPVFTFTAGRLTKKPQIGYSTENLINAAKVTGKKPKQKKKKRPVVKYRAPASHPLSPRKLGRNGKMRDYMISIEDNKLKNKAQCKAVAKRRVRQGLIEGVEIAFDSVIVPHLQLYDGVQVRDGTVSITARLEKMSWSLTTPTASYGYNRNLTPNVKKVRKYKK